MQTPTTIPRSARNRSEARQPVADYSAAVLLLAVHSVASALRTPTTTPHRPSAVRLPIPEAGFLAKTRLLDLALQQRAAEACLVEAAPPVDLVLPTRTLPLVALVPRQVALVQQTLLPQTMVPQAHHSRPLPRRTVPPQLQQRSTRLSPSSSRTRTTLSKSLG